jgi:hypothetical protein
VILLVRVRPTVRHSPDTSNDQSQYREVDEHA